MREIMRRLIASKNFFIMQSTKFINFRFCLLCTFLLLTVINIVYAEPVSSDQSFVYYQYPINGIVFEDLNDNGEKDEDESPLAKIPVSDGKTIVFTKKDGSFSFDNSDKKAKYVFVCIPNGFEKRPNFYCSLLDKTEEIKVEIPLKRFSKKEEKEFVFTQITDIHINSEDDMEIWGNTLKELAECEPKPSFIIATGDLVNRGDYTSQFETYTDRTTQSQIPIFNVAGNHDRCKGEDRALQYNRFLGPDYYSFNHGAFHFLILSNTIDNPYEEEWIQQDLKKLAKGKKILIFQHYPPYEEASKKYAEWGIDAVFSGHWHSSKITRYEDVLCYNIPPIMWGGIDLSPSGFLMVTVKGKQFSTEFRPNGVDNFLQIVSPAESSLIIAEKPLSVWVDAFNTKKPIVKITATIEGKYVTREVELMKQSPLSWCSEKPIKDLWPGDYTISLKTDPAIDFQPKKFKVKSSFYDPEYVQRIDKNWTAFMGGPTHSGCAEGAIKLPLHLEWIAPSGGFIDFSSPIIAGYELFIGVKDRDGLNKNGLLALNAYTGKRLWFAQTDSAINHCSVYNEDKIIAQEMGGRVHSFDAIKGKEIWYYDCGDPYFRWLYGAPMIADDKLFVGNSKWFAALNPATGEEIWHNTDGADWISSYCSPASADGKVLNGSNWLSIDKKWHGIYAMDSETGETLWGCDVLGVHSSPTIQGKKVFFNDIKGKFCIASLENGEILWQYEMLLDGNNWSSVTPAVKDDIVITGSSDGTMYAINHEKKEILWKFNTGKSIFRCAAYNRDYRSLLSSPTISGENVYFGSGDGKLYALDINTGEKKWEFTIGVPILSTPTIVGKWLFVGAYDGNVYAFRRWDFK